MYIMTSEFFQTQRAMLAILKDLHEDDHFAIILFDDNLDCWKESLTKATKENVADASIYIEKLITGGGQNNKN